MALDKLVDSTQLDGALTATANALRTKGGTSSPIAWDATNGFKAAVEALPSGTAAISVVDTTDTHGGTIREITALDISDTTAVAADVASGKYFYTADGTKTAGTASGGGGGLVYETGAYTPASDTTTGIIISFQNNHGDPPFFYIVNDSNAITGSRQAIGNTYINYGQLFGGIAYGESNTLYGYKLEAYSSNAEPLVGSPACSAGVILTPYNDSSSSSESQSQFWATNTGIKLRPGSRTIKAGRTYKWIAVWAPTT